MDIDKSLQFISRKAFPKVKQDWKTYSIRDDASLFRIIGWLHPLGDYISDNFRKGLTSLIKIIDSDELEPDMLDLAEKFLIALATNYINLHSDTLQNKQEIAYLLYKNNRIFWNAANQYAIHSIDLISNLIAYSLFKLDEKSITDICDNCVSQFRTNTKLFQKLIEAIRDEFKWNHSISDWVNGTNFLKYWELGKYLDSIFPELSFFKTSDGEYIQSIKNDFDEIEALVPLRKMFNKGILWVDIEELPPMLSFNYIYPNGKNGDILRFFLDEYGKTEEIGINLWKGTIERTYVHLFEILAPNAQKISNDPAFLNIFEHHIPTILYNKRMELFSSKVAARGKFYELGDKIKAHKLLQGEKRSEIYSQLVLTKKATPKWKSEVQLFSLVSSIYPDAVYQYHASWLGLQSLDVYIPSLSVGIEYQGKQHYVAIEHFGGEKHFEKQKANDKRKKKLCEENGVHLIEWSYRDPITKDKLEELLKV